MLGEAETAFHDVDVYFLALTWHIPWRRCVESVYSILEPADSAPLFPRCSVINLGVPSPRLEPSAVTWDDHWFLLRIIQTARLITAVFVMLTSSATIYYSK